jgi:translation initiation factor 1
MEGIMKKREQPPTRAGSGTVLGNLLQGHGFTPSPAIASPETDAGAEGKIELAGAGKLGLRRERKGRHGKTVTLLSGLDWPPARLDLLARALRKGLGCGSTVENGVIVLQGDIVPRAQTWLNAHGATKIVIGN